MLSADAGIGQETVYARLKQSKFAGAQGLECPTVGDHVTLLYNPAGDSQITGVQPRRSVFARKIAGAKQVEQAVAANFDEVFLLSSLNQDFSGRRLERYAALAWQSGATPVVVLTKLDVATDVEGMIQDAQAAAPGAPIYAVSAKTGEGLNTLAQRLRPGHTVVLLGSSGVGKSSLLNALAGEMLMDTGEIREDDARGRHTTTHRQMHRLPSGAYVIDTPGMREIGLFDSEEGVREAFEEIEELAKQCRFSDCAHASEPGCAVREAIEEGLLDEARYKSYRKLQREAMRRRKK